MRGAGPPVRARQLRGLGTAAEVDAAPRDNGDGANVVLDALPVFKRLRVGMNGVPVVRARHVRHRERDPPRGL